MRRIIALTAGAMLTAGAAAAQTPPGCYPDVDESKSQYIVGYGSLMQEASKKRSSPTSGPNRPVRVTGYQRVWNIKGDEIGFSTTFLGVEKDETAYMVAALYLDVNPEDIAGTDKREEFYCRDEVAPEALEVLDGAPLLSNAQIWIYFNREGVDDPPSPRWPVVQSYVDIFISGCMELEKKVVAGKFSNSTFSEECILTTEGWSKYWVNDRPYPRRPWVSQPKAGKIDALLHRMLPEEFDAIRIE